MCTVSVVAGVICNGQRWLRVACNRDELRTRPAALPPERRQVGDCRALLPIDPASGGTWIAATSAGLGFVLLNVNSGVEDVYAGKQSRGLIIPKLLDVADLDNAIRRVATIDAQRFAPFRLVLVSQWELAEFLWDGAAAQLLRREALKAAAFFTSSGLGDSLVDGARRRVFERYLVRATPTREWQDALHRHYWPDRPELSICMRRADARTVSFTTFEIGPDGVTLDYHANAPGQSAKTCSLCAPRLAACVA
jgi:uncharacterized protein with NRDE domain